MISDSNLFAIPREFEVSHLAVKVINLNMIHEILAMRYRTFTFQTLISSMLTSVYISRSDA